MTTETFEPVRLYKLMDYSSSLHQPKAIRQQWMRERERDQSQLELDQASCLVWEPVEGMSPKLAVAELVRSSKQEETTSMGILD